MQSFLTRSIVKSISLVVLLSSSILVFSQTAPKAKTTTKRKTTKAKVAPPAPAEPAAAPAPAPDPAPATAAAPAQASPETPAPAASTPTAPVSTKRPGVIRIGIVAPLTAMAQGGPGNEFSELIRQSLAAVLSSTVSEAMPLEARVPVLLATEAKEKECDYILYSSVTHRQRTNGLTKLLNVATPVVGVASVVGGAGTAASAAGQAASTATKSDTAMKTATDLSSKIPAGNEVVFEFKLVAPGSAQPKLAQRLKGKVKKEGEDPLSALLTEAANQILQTHLEKK